MNDNDDFTFNKKLNDGVRELIAGFDGDYFVTAVFNRNMTLAGAEKSLEHWCACLSKKLYGKQWYKLAASDRVQYIAFAEHLNSNVHWHLMLKVGKGRRAWKFRLFAEYLWEKYNKSGNMDVQKLIAQADKKATGFYVTKETWKQDNYNTIKLSA